MPELPEVETVRRGLVPVMEDARIAKLERNRPDLRFPFPPRFKARLEGSTITALARRAKYLLAHLDSGEVLIMHLGMSGSFHVRAGAQTGERVADGAYYERDRDPRHDHVVFHLDGPAGRATVTYNDPRRFGFMDLAAVGDLPQNRFLRDLGVEPTGNELDGVLLAGLLTGRHTSLKAALLDQKTIAGLGNIYACEALWRAGLSPRRLARSVAGKDGAGTERSSRLAEAIRSVIADAIEAGGSSLRDHRHTDGSLGYFQHEFAAYDRDGEPCRKPGCSGHIERIVQSGRSTFFCPVCQR